MTTDIAPYLAVELASRQRRRTRVAAAAVAFLAAGGLASHVVGSASDSGDRALHADPPPGERYVPVVQSPALRWSWGWDVAVTRYYHRLLTAAEDHADYTASTLRLEQHLLIIYGTGSPAPDVAALLAAPPPNARAIWSSVPYSKSQLGAAATDIRRSVPGASVRFTPDYQALIVAVRRLPGDDAELVRLRRLVRASADIPVQLQQVDGVPG